MYIDIIDPHPIEIPSHDLTDMVTWFESHFLLVHSPLLIIESHFVGKIPIYKHPMFSLFDLTTFGEIHLGVRLG